MGCGRFLLSNNYIHQTLDYPGSTLITAITFIWYVLYVQLYQLAHFAKTTKCMQVILRELFSTLLTRTLWHFSKKISHYILKRTDNWSKGREPKWQKNLFNCSQMSNIKTWRHGRNYSYNQYYLVGFVSTFLPEKA